MQPKIAVLGVILVLALLLASPFFAPVQQPGKASSYHFLIAERGAERIQADRPAR